MPRGKGFECLFAFFLFFNDFSDVKYCEDESRVFMGEEGEHDVGAQSIMSTA